MADMLRSSAPLQTKSHTYPVLDPHHLGRIYAQGYLRMRFSESRSQAALWALGRIVPTRVWRPENSAWPVWARDSPAVKRGDRAPDWGPWKGILNTLVEEEWCD
ncbi:hypothetical protein NDU88_000105 [Pleurodeles waltl]|uniref:Uncharacterized protein n=1 Tax=Pleurodeles waltl TaxID=8319 RepID=A0AAV7KLR4_PLEWA|nr:hypothetical protein NDU88_000105 [Pleurodeles waltl]